MRRAAPAANAVRPNRRCPATGWGGTRLAALITNCPFDAGIRH